MQSEGQEPESFGAKFVFLLRCDTEESADEKKNKAMKEDMERVTSWPGKEHQWKQVASTSPRSGSNLLFSGYLICTASRLNPAVQVKGPERGDLVLRWPSKHVTC